LRAQGLTATVVGRAQQAFGPVMRGRAQWFEERGLTAPGQCEEELVVVRGVRA
jgi:release factor glutamine methyltransferase